MNKIICGNCTTVLKTLPKFSVDLTVTSPPYDEIRDYKGYQFNYRQIIRALWSATKQGGVVVWVVADQTINRCESGTSLRQALEFTKVGFCLHDTMIYERAPRFPEQARYPQWFEYMFVFSKGQPNTTNLLMDRKNTTAGQTGGHYSRNKETGELEETSATFKRPRREYGPRKNIWTYQAGSQESEDLGHPAKFPDQLALDHILTWSNPGDLVLDPMCGSGTTCAMAYKAGRYYIGIDISQEYCQIARGRVVSVQQEEQYLLASPQKTVKPLQRGKGLINRKNR